MARSYRHTPIAGIASWNGVGWFKRLSNSRERNRWKNAIRHGDFETAEYALPWDEWDCPRDGKKWMGDWFGQDKKRLSK